MFPTFAVKHTKSDGVEELFYAQSVCLRLEDKTIAVFGRQDRSADADGVMLINRGTVRVFDSGREIANYFLSS